MQMVSLSTASTETDIVGLARANEIILPSSQFEVPCGSITLYNSERAHIGTKIIADSVTYINEDQYNNKKDISLLKNNIMIIIVATLLTVILILIVIKNTSDVNNSGKKIITDSTTKQSTTIEYTTPTTTAESIITEPATIKPLPHNWLILYDTWSINKNLPCNYATSAYTISLETIHPDACENSKDFLISYENKYTLKHNFYISGDGYVFEGFGWNCSAEYNYRYSRSVIKIAFFCSADNFDSLLENLINDGLNKTMLHQDYNILPECCRNPTNSSINNKIMDFIIYKKTKAFKNPTCTGYNPQCHIIR